MNTSQQVARVYAEALVDMATSGDADLGRIYDDLRAVQSVAEYARSNDPAFALFFNSPKLEPARKKQVLMELFGDKLERPVLGLLSVLVDKRREPYFDNIVAEFERYKDLRDGRVHAHVTTARPLDEDQRQELRSELEKSSGKSVKLHEQVDPRLIGGLIVKVGDKIIDGSIRRRMRRLRRRMLAGQE